ncbi:zinc finger protein 397-like [Alosa sapidissima]|uniref:zinc finger protein 397-like n=1 Tax=Alosa sapidissima TaxID=34773 RepID=UPI001C0831F3|nr:zinc finger protein 397-like [Alosa sapidissima]
MDVIRCVRSLMDLQAQLQRAIGLQEEIQTEVLAHLLLPQSTRRLKIPEGFGASEDVEAYFATFERAATSLKLPQKTWRAQVMKLLGMDYSEGQDSSLQDHGYEVVKDHLHSQASVAEQQWQVNFTLANFDPVKGPRELGLGLDEAARRWLKPERRSAEDVVQRVALQKFVTLLPRAVSDWVVQHKCKDMEEAISLAEQFLGRRTNEEYGEREEDTAGQQYTATDPSDKSGASNQFRVTTDNAQEGKEPKPWTTAPKEEETSLKLCQPVSFNVEVEGMGEIYLKEEGGEEQEEYTPHIEQMPVEEEDDDMCSGEIVIEPPSDIGQPSVTTTRRQPGWKPTFRVKKMYFGANEATLTKSHACSDCGKSFTRLFHLRRHKCGSALLACQKCETTFASSSTQLAQHRHSHDEFHSCPYCVRQFRKKSNLQNHVRMHTGERRYQCPDCGDTFTQKHVMLEHRNIHTGQRPFVCHECGKGFCHSRTLSKHRQLHSDLRPFLCTLCGKTFKIKDGLRRHQLVHEKNSEKTVGMLK